MLRSLAVKRFKSLADVGPVELAPLSVFFGPNAAGKSNFLDAVQVLSRLASEKTLADALGEPIRGRALEAFAFPPDGLPGLLQSTQADFELDALVGIDAEPANGSRRENGSARYRVRPAIRPDSGTLAVEDEYLAALDARGQPKGDARIERDGSAILVRQKSRPGRPRRQPVGSNYTQVSDRRFSGVEYTLIERAREELSSWRSYYLDPRVAMRSAQPPQEVADIGPLGEHVAPFLYRLAAEEPRAFAAIKRTLRALIPSIEDLRVDLDARRGILDVEVRQDGTPFSARIVSEGTLRVLALACVAANPWGGTLAAFEEPENGVHPRRIELVADMLVGMATEGPRRRQILVTTHSPIFCAVAIRHARRQPEQVALYRVVRQGRDTRIERFSTSAPLFTDEEIRKALTAPTDDGVFEGLLLRGLLDA